MRITDADGNTIEKTITIEVTNSNEFGSDQAEAVPSAAPEAARDGSFDVRAGDQESQPDRSLVETDLPAADLPEYEADVAAMPSAEQTINWVASEIQEISELAQPIESIDFGLPESTDLGGDTTFDDQFEPVDHEVEVQEDVTHTDIPEQDNEPRSDGFLGKFWTMLRFGFGTTNSADSGPHVASISDKSSTPKSGRRK